MKKIVLLLLGSLWILSLQAQEEKVKEVESKSYDFRIDKVVVFINMLDNDLKTPIKGNIIVKNSKGEVIQTVSAEGITELRLPIKETYQIEVSREGFASENMEIDLRKVDQYEYSQNVYLKPKKSEVRVSAKDLGSNPSNLILKMENQGLNEQVLLKYDPAKNDFYGQVRDGQDYQLEVRNPVNNFAYTQSFKANGSGAGNNGMTSNNIDISPDKVKPLTKGTFVYEDEKKKVDNLRPTPAKVNIDSLLATLDLSRRKIAIDSVAAVYEAKIQNNASNQENNQNIDNRPEPKSLEELIARTEEDMLASEKALIDQQEKVKERLDQLNGFMEDDKLSDKQKDNLKEVVSKLEKQLEQYDIEYQKLRAVNFQQLDRLQSKLGMRSFNSFLRQYWYLFYILFGVIAILMIAMIVFYFIARTRRKQRDKMVLLNEEINQQNEEITAQRDAIEDKNKLIEIERQKSDELLLNILPVKIADELKTYGKAKMRNYRTVSILFTDFKGFTNIAATMSPDKLMEELNDCFTAFDQIIVKHNLEKIKTIGDAYMCAGGIPEENATNPIDSVLAGIEIQQFMVRRRSEKLAEGDDYWQCRLGINTGEIRAGVIGTSKFAYDIWGDPVNIASRMESGGEINKVNISEQTYEVVKDFFVCVSRGEVEVKNGLTLGMYFVERIRPELSADEEGLTPNNDFINLKYERFGQLKNQND
jgi:class 3 adenylate cyclase